MTRADLRRELCNEADELDLQLFELMMRSQVILWPKCGC